MGDSKGQQTFDGAHERLTELSLLETGWLDGEGVPPSDLSISSARHLVEALGSNISVFGIFPTPEGGISFEGRTKRARVGIQVSHEHPDDYALRASILNDENGTRLKSRDGQIERRIMDCSSAEQVAQIITKWVEEGL